MFSRMYSLFPSFFLHLTCVRNYLSLGVRTTKLPLVSPRGLDGWRQQPLVTKGSFIADWRLHQLVLFGQLLLGCVFLSSFATWG